MRNRTRHTAAGFVLLFSWALIPSSGSSQNQPQNAPATDTQSQKNKIVYVCACLKTKSCACMTEAKTKGPCACGTKGGPPLKAVPRDSDWAKENREALAN